LAKKLKNCGVFGVSSDECLSYDLQNRSEWADSGQGIVGKYVAELNAMFKESAVFMLMLVTISIWLVPFME
jgi:hypothetical protein